LFQIAEEPFDWRSRKVDENDTVYTVELSLQHTVGSACVNTFPVGAKERCEELEEVI
jgi:hypothetical protein